MRKFIYKILIHRLCRLAFAKLKVRLNKVRHLSNHKSYEISNHLMFANDIDVAVLSYVHKHIRAFI